MSLYRNETLPRNHFTMRHTILCDRLLARDISDPLAVDAIHGIDGESTETTTSQYDIKRPK